MTSSEFLVYTIEIEMIRMIKMYGNWMNNPALHHFLTYAETDWEKVGMGLRNMGVVANLLGRLRRLGNSKACFWVHFHNPLLPTIAIGKLEMNKTIR